MSTVVPSSNTEPASFTAHTQVPKEARRTTLRDVANRAGVQTASASVVLNKSKSNTHVSEAARQRILMAAEELGYRRNGSAQAFRTGHFGAVALLLSTNPDHSGLPQRLWDGIHDELAAHDMTLSMARLPDEKLTDEGVVPRMLREWMSDGLLIDYTNHIPTRMIELIDQHNLPAVWINAQQENDCVYPDDYEASVHLTRHLLQLGHRRILHVDFTHEPNDAHEHYSYRDRIAGYRAAMQEAKLTARVEPDQWMPPRQRIAHVVELLQETQRPTAFITYGDIEIDLIAAAAGELGLRVPSDLSLASFGPMGARYPGLALTASIVPEYEIGRNAVRMLLEKIKEPTRELAPRIVPFGWSEGETCAPVSS